MAKNLYEETKKKGHKITTDKKGLDYALYDLHKNNMLDIDDLKNFDYIRKVTDDTETFNWYAKELLAKNDEFVRDSPLLKQLVVHYSTWQAKYQLYKDDRNMCLIYAGPDQHARFPNDTDDSINERIMRLKKQIKLDD
jgi:hypothetical protein